MTDTDLAFASIEEISRLFRKRKLSPVELVRLMFSRITQLDSKLNSYITVTTELALAQAKKAESELFAPRRTSSRSRSSPRHTHLSRKTTSTPKTSPPPPVPASSPSSFRNTTLPSSNNSK